MAYFPCIEQYSGTYVQYSRRHITVAVHVIRNKESSERKDNSTSDGPENRPMTGLGSESVFDVSQLRSEMKKVIRS
jgi:hypothetical protein